MTAPWLTLVPGIAIVLTVLSLNVFGDGLRDALDPRAKVRIEHLMVAFILRRIIGMIAVLFAVSVLVFIVFILVPGGDPADGWPARTRPSRTSSTSARSGASTGRSTSSTCG